MASWSVRVALAGKGSNMYDIIVERSCLHWKGERLPDKWLAVSDECDEH